MVELHKLTKNEKKRLKAKEKKSSQNNIETEKKNSNRKPDKDDDNDDDVEIEYVSMNPLDALGDSSLVDQFKNIFEKFTKPEELIAQHNDVNDKNQHDNKEENEDKKADNHNDNNGNNENDDGDKKQATKISKKKKKLMTRLSVAVLKQLVPRPDVVEAHDVCSSDPRLLVYLKASRNTVPVPRHWCAIRKYLQGKRGVEKPPFQLPEFIADTGIAKIRDAVLEQESKKSAKQKGRERLTAKTGKIDIDYQVLHDAFFKFQTKPKVTRHGELYYEGKEFETEVKEKTPGILSSELKTALGMTDLTPPPWLINMQRYGPPPSYPSMRIPGLNAPIPAGTQFGFQPGGWGKPPVDEYGRPLYGDVFGTVLAETETVSDVVDKTTKWGELLVTETQYEDEGDEEESEAEEDEEDADAAGYGRGGTGGLETPSSVREGMSSVQTGLETPDVIDLRKRAGGLDTPDTMYSGQSRELYTVIQEKAVQGGVAAGQMFGSDRTYSIPTNTSDGDQQQQQDGDEHGASATAAGEGGEAQGGDDKGKRKRRLDSSTITKRYKDFKF